MANNFRVAGFVLGLAIKAPCHTVATSNIPASLLSGFGANPINGYSVGAFDRVLLTAQTDPIDNGIYSVRETAWIRDGDADANRDWVGGTLVPVWTPSLSDIVLWRLGGDPDAKTVGVDALTFTVYFDPSTSSEIDTLQSVTVRGKTTDQGMDVITGGVLRLFDSLDGQSLDIDMTGNPARLTVTAGSGIQFLGGSLEYFFDNDIRIAGNVTAQNNGLLLSLNNLGTARMSINHDDVRGILESTLGPLDIRVDNGSGAQVRRLLAVNGATGGVSLYAGAGDNPILRTNVVSGATGNGIIMGVDVKDHSDVYRQVGKATILRLNVTGSVSFADNIWHERITAVGNTTATIDAADHVNIPEGAVCWFVGNGGSIVLTEGVGMVFRKFLGGGASVTGTVTIADGGWVTCTKNLDGEFWFVGQDLS